MRFYVGILIGFSCAFQGAFALQANPNEMALEDYFQLPRLANVVLSPNGQYLAATTRVSDRMNIAVINLATQKPQALTSFTDSDVVRLRWVGNDRILFSLGNYGDPSMTRELTTGGGLFVVNRNGSGFRVISDSVQQALAKGDRNYRSLEFVQTIPDHDDEIIAVGNLTVSDSSDVYRVNLNNGKSKLLSLGRPAIQAGSWILDKQLLPRVVMGSVKDSNTVQVHYRDSASSPWTQIAEFNALKGPAFVPLALQESDHSLWVASSHGRDTMAIYKFDLVTKQFSEQIAQHPQFDMGATAMGTQADGLVFDPQDQSVVGLRVNASKPQKAWLSPLHAAVQAQVDKALPDRINDFELNSQSSKVLITSYSDVHPERWYVFDQTQKTLEEVGNSKPQLEGQLVKQMPFTFESRDGLKFNGYYFLPKDYKKGQQLPTIVHVHGGPFARADYFGRGFGYREAQLFASWGYAVILPNFRITPGLGGKNYYAGFGSFGKEMLFDHEDAVKWGVQEGFVNPAKVCISGASYGGYAALMGPAINPSFYKCAISGLAPTDMKYQLSTMDGDTALSIAGQYFWLQVIGAKDLTDPILARASPLSLAKNIQIPVFMYAGKFDYRVPYPQIEKMAKALTESGNPPKEFVAIAGEGHGFTKPANNIILYGKIKKFLAEQLTAP
jgi:dipeptidyl aminopeptidase/acylaminoacyl peptidase